MDMNRNIKRIALGVGAVILVGTGLTACTSDAHRVSDNLSTEAEQFRVTRDIVFYNGITDKYVAEVKGRCSVDVQDGLPGDALAVTCKTGSDSYTKDYLGLSDNVTWFAIQTEPNTVSPYAHEIVFKPQNVGVEITGSDAG